MTKPFVDWIATNADLAVALSLVLVALTFAVLGLIATLILRPKLKELEDARIQLAQLQQSLSGATQAIQSVPDLSRAVTSVSERVSLLVDAELPVGIAQLQGRVSTIEGAKEAERVALQQQLKLLEESVSRTIADMQKLQQRSENEIARIQAASLDGLTEIKESSKTEVLRLQAIERHRLALEQAGQDVELASIAEQLARLSPAQYPQAEERLRFAQMRLQTLQFQGPKSE